MSYPPNLKKQKQIANLKNEAKLAAEQLISDINFLYSSSKPIDPKCLQNIRSPQNGQWIKSIYNADLSLYSEEESQNPTQTLDSVKGISTLISQNLTKAGINKNYSIIIAQYLTGAIRIRLPLFLVGNTAEKVAEAIAQSVYGTHPNYIFIPTGFSDIESLIRTINDCKSNVVVLRNSTEFIDESFFAQLTEYVPNKQILFSVSLHETPSLFHPSIYEYAGIIDCEGIWMYLLSPSFDMKQYSQDLVPTQYNQKSYTAFLKLISTLTKPLELTNGYCMKRALLLTVLFDNIDIGEVRMDNIDLYIFPLLYELYIISSYIGKTKEYVEQLQKIPDKRPYNRLKFIIDE